MQSSNGLVDESSENPEAELLETATKLVRSCGRPHVQQEYLRRSLDVSLMRAVALIPHLVKAGVIGERQPSGYPVLSEHAPPPATITVEPTLEGMVKTIVPAQTRDAISAPAAAASNEPVELTLSPEEISDHAGTQIRAELNAAKVAEYRVRMSDGDIFPPIEVFRHDGTYYKVDGAHRLQAAKELKCRTIRVRVVNASMRDAILFALAANARHGLPLTRADRRRAAMALLQDSEWSQFTDKEIGQRCGLSGMSVGRFRAQLHSENNKVKPATRKRHGADGKVRAIRVGNQGRKRRQDPNSNGVHPVMQKPAVLDASVTGSIARMVQQLVSHLDELLAGSPASFLTFCGSDPGLAECLREKATALLALLSSPSDTAAAPSKRSAA